VAHFVLRYRFARLELGVPKGGKCGAGAPRTKIRPEFLLRLFWAFASRASIVMKRTLSLSYSPSKELPFLDQADKIF